MNEVKEAQIQPKEIEKAAAQFGGNIKAVDVLGEGLIHKTYKVSFTDTPTIVLQCINQKTFKHPEDIIHNYLLIAGNQKSGTTENHTKIPALLSAKDGNYFWRDREDNFWRATQFVDNSYAPYLPENKEQVEATAATFAAFAQSLSNLDSKQFRIIIPDFHNLHFRYQQFEDAINQASPERLQNSEKIISELRQRHQLVDYYDTLHDEKNYPTRIMHHDCKISNVLFDKNSQQVICPVDFDTVMPGKYFSDIGDMIRSMACTSDENDTAWEDITINPAYYKSMVKGYLEGIGNAFTKKEIADIHYSGLLMIYMQALRFIADYLNNDIYYQTTYAEQNFNRALNQLILLQQLEKFLKTSYQFNAYQH